MDEKIGSIEKMHLDEGLKKIDKLKKKIDSTKYNVEIAGEIIADTPSNAQREKLIEKNKQRHHGIGSMLKEIRDIEQEIEERSREEST